MTSQLDSKAEFGAADAYIERVGNDLEFRDGNNTTPVTLSQLLSARQIESTMLTLYKGAAAYRSPPPELVAISGTTNTNSKIPAYAYDDTTEEFIAYTVQLPSNLYTDGSATIRIQWLPATASSNNVVWKVYHKSISAGSSIDEAFASDTVISAGNATTDVISQATITDTIDNFGWEAGGMLIIHISRDATNGSDNLTGDAYLVNFVVEASLIRV